MGIEVTQSFNVVITTTRVETGVAPSTNVVRGGVLIRIVTKFDRGLGEVSVGRNLTRVVGTPQMVFTNSIMTIHVNKITKWPPMSSIVVRRYKSINVTNPIGRHWKPSIIIQGILDHKNVVFKYPNFIKYDDPNAHVIMFNYVVNANAKTSKEYIVNAFNYMLRNITLD